MPQRFAKSIDGHRIQFFARNDESGLYDAILEDEHNAPRVCNGGAWLLPGSVVMVEPNEAAKHPGDPQWKVVSADITDS